MQSHLALVLLLFFPEVPGPHPAAPGLADFFLLAARAIFTRPCPGRKLNWKIATREFEAGLVDVPLVMVLMEKRFSFCIHSLHLSVPAKRGSKSKKKVEEGRCCLGGWVRRLHSVSAASTEWNRAKKEWQKQYVLLSGAVMRVEGLLLDDSDSRNCLRWK
ncbi:hypothetical protein R1flu_024150 [Riccia fluitans]|uniref:Uncharacterized protein n=1 Tax=Riccia fluitans TaxID=41844 RepID=A0ABD1XU22_9MARC